MTKLSPKLLATVCAALLCTAGCASDDDAAAPAGYEPPASPINLRGHTKDVRIGTRDLTLDYIANERHGAAIAQGSYKHVLAQDDYQYADSPMLSAQVRYDRKHHYTGVKFTPIEVQYETYPHSAVSSDGLPLSCNPYFPALSEMQLGKAQDYSAAELKIWQKFCDCGRDLTDADWDFLRAHADAFPFELKAACRPPEYQTLQSRGMAAKPEELYRQAFGGARKGALK